MQNWTLNLFLLALFLLFIWKFGRNNKTNKNFNELKSACLGDEKKASRLIEYEQKLNPTLSKNDAAKYAFDRLERNRS